MSTSATATQAGNDFDVLRAIWAIPASVLSAAANKLLCVHVNHAACGRSTCTASNETLAFEAGVTSQRITKLNAELVRDGWLVEVRHGKSKYTERHFEVGPKTAEWVERNISQFSARKEQKRAKKKPTAPSRIRLGAKPPVPSHSRPLHLVASDAAPSQGRPVHLVGDDYQNSSCNAPVNTAVEPEPSDDDELRSAQGGEKTPEVGNPEEVPASTLEVISREIGADAAAEVRANYRQFHGACRGRWGCLEAGAKEVRRADDALRKKGRRVESLVGLLNSKTRQFADQGIPDSLRPAPPPPPPPDPRELAMNESKFRVNVQVRAWPARQRGLEWLEVLEAFQADLKTNNVALGLTPEEGETRLRWLQEEISNYQEQEVKHRADQAKRDKLLEELKAQTAKAANSSTPQGRYGRRQQPRETS